MSIADDLREEWSKVGEMGRAMQSQASAEFVESLIRAIEVMNDTLRLLSTSNIYPYGPLAHKALTNVGEIMGKE